MVVLGLVLEKGEDGLGGKMQLVSDICFMQVPTLQCANAQSHSLEA